ncbi:Flp pilus assembly protein CpaB [Rhizomicrobium electricum]|uniref:Flp pilus assembly protein CpaB n=1 Tax=Rhizomicrobium electricum TaxID=480070 RepID=A0ABN1F4Q7_9PROT|nr:Flp pilus assembly protein CpaB [Rhizomicrobium electricum]NIJ49432.1 pilus assembly protein CpaB [Rhizomicrobium electricum]
MNTRRLVVLLLAAGAAGVVALMVRGFVGGGTKQAEAKVATPAAEITQILVAATRLDPGRPMTADSVRWEAWPVKAVDASFIRKTPGTTPATLVAGMVVRAPMVPGEPVTFAKIIKSQSPGFMAATIAPGMRAVAISVSVASVAGGFILPNNRVDIMLTMVTGDNPKRGSTRTVLADVRVLAVDQTLDKPDQKPTSDVKTVTLELTPEQAHTVATAQAMGMLSLTLRSLGDEQTATADAGNSAPAPDDQSSGGIVTVIRYGTMRKSGGGGGPQ